MLVCRNCGQECNPVCVCCGHELPVDETEVSVPAAVSDCKDAQRLAKARGDELDGICEVAESHGWKAKDAILTDWIDQSLDSLLHFSEEWNRVTSEFAIYRERWRKQLLAEAKSVEANATKVAKWDAQEGRARLLVSVHLAQMAECESLEAWMREHNIQVPGDVPKDES